VKYLPDETNLIQLYENEKFVTTVPNSSKAMLTAPIRTTQQYSQVTNLNRKNIRRPFWPDRTWTI